MIIVTHDPELASKCDMQINIKDGKIESIDKTHKKIEISEDEEAA